MFFKRFYDAKLAQASYIVGCQSTGECVVVDPNRDVRQYVEAAAAEKLRVTHVTETHIHADFVSGARELARATGASLLLSAEGGPDWQYAFAAADGARLLRDGDAFMVGNVELRAMHTPGHTPEHLSFVVTDTPAAAGPWGILTGDFVFVGDVGRPDLLEKAAGQAGTMEDGARSLFRSLERFRALPDHLQVWPGHGAGSACGKSLGAMPSTTVGYERIGNWGVAATNESEFVRTVLDGQPEPPRYFARMKRVNREGPRLLGDVSPAGHLPAESLERALGAGGTVLDTRRAAAFAAGHVKGTINIPLSGSFTTWAGWLVPYDRPLYLVADDAARAVEASRDLAMIGLDDVAGYFTADALDAWRASGRELERVEQASAREVAAMLERGEAYVVDVRGADEWREGHLPGAPNLPLGQLPDRLAELRTDLPVVVQCQSGGRSSIAASILLARGVGQVINLAGGITGWREEGRAVSRAESDEGTARRA